VKNLIPLFLAILLIGAGCVFQKESPVGVGEPVVVQTQYVNGIVEAYDDATNIASVRTATGATEEVLWPAGAQAASELFGTIVVAKGERDPSTLVVVAEAVDVPASQNLMVASPAIGATVTSPLVVSGFGRVFEQTFNWRIKDTAGAVIGEGIAMTDARDVGWFGPFTFEVFLPAMTETAFTLDVLDYSARDGSEQDLVSVSLNLLSTKTSTFKVYFEKPSQGNSFDCSQVFPVQRTLAETAAIGRASIAELLKGPTDEERAQGFSTSIPAYAALNSLVIGDRTAKADFTRDLEPGGGSCRVTAIRSQIENTILQFDSVETVVISVKGETDTALQP